MAGASRSPVESPTTAMRGGGGGADGRPVVGVAVVAGAGEDVGVGEVGVDGASEASGVEEEELDVASVVVVVVVLTTVPGPIVGTTGAIEIWADRSSVAGVSAGGVTPRATMA